jgi:peptidylprolyl isomerase
MIRLTALAFLLAMLTVSPVSAQSKANTLTLETTKGRIVIRLRADLAPKHAERLATLAREKFYDNVPFHRVMDGFMAQTGDGERGDGRGKSKYPDLQAEFSRVPFTRGVVGMARGAHSIHSANSQFFIMYAENAGLNGQYTVVGEVVSGMDVADKLKKGPRERDGAVADPDKIVRATAGGS